MTELKIEKYIAVLETSAQVIKVDKKCREMKLNISVMPLPKKYSSDCGMCLVFDGTKKERVLEIIKMLNFNAKIYDKD